MEASGFLDPAAALRAAKVHEGMKVADFGSASGFFVREAARLVGEGGEVWAVEPTSDLLARIRSVATAEGLHNIELVAGNIEERGGSHLPDEAIDLVIAANVLFSCENKEAVVEEIWRVLNARGRALVIDWKGSFGGLGPHPSHIVEEADARKLFEQGGFTIVEAIAAGAYHWGFVVRRHG